MTDDIDNEVGLEPAQEKVETKKSVTTKDTSSSEKFSKEYVSDLRQEAALYRTKLKETEAKFSSKESEFEEKIGYLTKKIEIEAKEKINAKLESAAVQAGIKDVDLIKLIDESLLKNENGQLSGMKEAIEDLKTRKPFLFGEEKKTFLNSSSSSPRKEKPQPVDFMKMTDEDFLAYENKMWRNNRETGFIAAEEYTE